jgi:hypothetical protein
MDAEGNLYASDREVPAEDAERAKAWMAELDASIKRASEQARTDQNPLAHLKITGSTR